MFVTPALVILTGVVMTFTGISLGSRLSRRPRPIDDEGSRDHGGGLLCGVVVIAGAVTVVLGIVYGLFVLFIGA